MPKRYSDRQMKSAESEREYYFPKFGQVIKAKSRGKAEKKLQAKLTKK